MELDDEKIHHITTIRMLAGAVRDLG